MAEIAASWLLVEGIPAPVAKRIQKSESEQDNESVFIAHTDIGSKRLKDPGIGFLWNQVLKCSQNVCNLSLLVIEYSYIIFFLALKIFKQLPILSDEKYQI